MRAHHYEVPELEQAEFRFAISQRPWIEDSNAMDEAFDAFSIAPGEFEYSDDAEW
jgi:hypothetical protein